MDLESLLEHHVLRGDRRRLEVAAAYAGVMWRLGVPGGANRRLDLSVGDQTF